MIENLHSRDLKPQMEWLFSVIKIDTSIKLECRDSKNGRKLRKRALFEKNGGIKQSFFCIETGNKEDWP
jgi:hypothetical protein